MSIETMSLEEMKNYLGTGKRPEDFETFWNNIKNELPVPTEYSLQKNGFETEHVECFDLTYTAFDGSEIYAKVTRPKNRNKVPALFYFHGYRSSSLDWWHKVFLSELGYCSFSMDCRGQGGLSYDHGYHPGNSSIGQLVEGLEGEVRQMTVANIYMDVIQLVKLVQTFDFVEGDDLSVCGGSQGGALSLFTAAMFKEVKKCAVLYPFLSDFERIYKLDPRGSAYEELFHLFRISDPLHNKEEGYFKKYAYVDIKNFAPMVRSEVLMATGLKDESCPASTQFAVYNNLHTRKEHILYPEFGHEDLPDYIDKMAMFLKQ